MDGLIDYFKKHREIPDISKKQRFLNRPLLEEIFYEGVIQDKVKRNEKIFEAVETHGYRQREVADHLGIFFTTVSRIMRREQSK